MARPSLTLAKALSLATKLVKDDDSNADPLIELFLGMTDSAGDATQQAIRTAVLKAWYCQTQDFRDHFREYIGENIDQTKASEDEEEMIESNAPAS